MKVRAQNPNRTKMIGTMSIFAETMDSHIPDLITGRRASTLFGQRSENATTFVGKPLELPQKAI
jgi:hypothetical protein